MSHQRISPVAEYNLLLDEEQERIRQHFDARSDYWLNIYQDRNSYAGYTLQKQQRAILDFIEQLPSEASIVDVGCGAGVTVRALAEKGYHASGIDMSPQMIDRAQQEAYKHRLACDFKVSFAEALPYPDQHFDALIALGLLGNIRDDQPVLNEMYRVLKPGGCLLVTVPNRLALDLMIAFPRSLPIYFLGTRFRQHLRAGGNLLRSILGRPIKHPSTLTYGRLVTPHTFVKRLYQHGFSKVRYVPLTFGPIMPFGIRWGSHQSPIRVSEAIASWVARSGHFRWGGTSMLYVAYRRSSEGY